MIRNVPFLKGKGSFTRAYEPIEEMITVKATVVPEVKILFIIYLPNGTSELFRDVKRSLKFFNVGLLTKNFGGNKNNSVSGLKAVEIT